MLATAGEHYKLSNPLEAPNSIIASLELQAFDLIQDVPSARA